MGCASSADAGASQTTSIQPADSPPLKVAPKSSSPVVFENGDSKSTPNDEKSLESQTKPASTLPQTVQQHAPLPTGGANRSNEHAHEHHTHELPKGVKERRAAAGADAMRDQIRKLAVGGPSKPTGPGEEEGPGVYQVSDSEDSEDEEGEGLGTGGWKKPDDVTEAVCEALKRTFVFKGISESLLMDVVARMYGVCFKAGSVVLQQGALPKPDDCMYFLQHGEAEVVISGAVDQNKKRNEDTKVEGHTLRILQKPGWVFGDVALLFHSSRTASVEAKSNITVWALERRTFLKFVMRHAQGARALRFLRKLPLLKGLSDNDLIRAASRMPQRVYKNDQALIKYGERGDELYLIRYGKVKVMRPDGNGGQVVAVVLGRGQFIGERAVINNRMRSADCIAQGDVQVVVMKKRDFMDLDNPLLAWMLDYDAVATCLRGLPYVKGLKQEQMESILDRFDPREEKYQGDVVLKQGELVEKIYVIKMGEVRVYKDNRPVADANFVHEVGGFSFFGETALEKPFKSPFNVVVHTETIQILTLPKRQLDNFLGKDTGLNSIELIHAALKNAKGLKNITESEAQSLVQAGKEQSYSSGEVIVAANSPDTDHIYLIMSGEAALVPGEVALPGQVDVGQLAEQGRLLPGSVFNDDAIIHPDSVAITSALVAVTGGTSVVSFTLSQLDKICCGKSRRGSLLNPIAPLSNVDFHDLELHRIIGTGQFGMVRLVRNKMTNEVFALKEMFKAPITDSKQIEHVLNERRILEQAQHPFCVRLAGAYQDKHSLYLLQEWVPGGELFHHLDLEGAFDEQTSRFFAANVLVALEFLHSKGIVYRDLKPENLLVDAEGYLKVADMGFAKYLGDEKTFTICGTPDYQAPEVIMRRGTNKAADYWALGVLIFEMLVGDPPFKSLTGDPWDTFRRTLSGRFFVPNFISDSATDLIFKLLQVNPEKRLGSGPTGAQEIRDHRWFASVDWNALLAKQIQAPLVPRIRNPLDTSNFDNFDSCDVEPPPVPPNAYHWGDLWEAIDERP